MFLSLHKYSSRDSVIVWVFAVFVYLSVSFLFFFSFSLKVVLCQLFYAYVSDLCVTVKYCTNIQLKKTLLFLIAFRLKMTLL